MDIKEIAKKMTREDFVKIVANDRYEQIGMSQGCPETYGLNSFGETEKCCLYDNNVCENCWGNAVKDIKFKDDMEKLLVKVGVVEFYENGIVKFPKNNNKTWMQQAMEHVEPIVKDKLEKAIKNYLEGDKMENKVSKVICINEGRWPLTLHREYPVIEETRSQYKIMGDDLKISLYSKVLFRRVEDVLMVECIDNQQTLNNLIIGKSYQVIREDEKQYKVKNERSEEIWINKSRFKRVEPQKEVKEYTLMELLDFPVGTKFYRNQLECVAEVEEIETSRGEKVKRIICNATDADDKGIEFTEIWAKAKYTKVEELKPVSFIEAWKALEEGATIECLRHNIQYKLNNKGDLMERDSTLDNFESSAYINWEEIKGQWIIKGDK